MDQAIDSTTVTDSAIPFAVPVEQFRGRLNVVSVAPLIGETIRRLHGGGSIDELLEEI
jgi:ribose-phosphate pyrophosphokinase